MSPAPSGRLPASAGAFPDQVVFKLGNACKHGHDQLASVTGSVGPGFGLVLSQGDIAMLLKHGIGEDEIGITALRETASRVLGDSIVPWFWSYRLRLGVK